MTQHTLHSPVFVIGLMSGTSADGIDACVLHTDGVSASRTGIQGSFGYRPDIRRAIMAARSDPASWLASPQRRAALNKAITEDHAQAVLSLASQSDRSIELIGFHGQTIYHNPAAKRTIQLGDGQMLARLTGYDTIYDFRHADMNAGGQGAPLAPIYHQTLARDAGLDLPVLFLNLGGVANVSLVEQDRLTGCDIGPANGLIDDYCQTVLGLPFDDAGALASKGTIDQSLIEETLQHPFFALTGPRSLDRATFSTVLHDKRITNTSPANALASLTEITARAVHHYVMVSGASPCQLILSGGGIKNTFLFTRIATHLPEDMPCVTADDAGFNNDMMEAELIAYLAARRLANLPSTFPETTGVSAPQICGIFQSGLTDRTKRF